MSGNPHLWYHTVCNQPQYEKEDNPMRVFAEAQAVLGNAVCVQCMLKTSYSVKVIVECLFRHAESISVQDSAPKIPQGLSPPLTSMFSTPSRNESIRSIVRNRHFVSTNQV